MGSMAVVSLVCGTMSASMNAWSPLVVDYSPVQRFCQMFPNFPGCRDTP